MRFGKITLPSLMLVTTAFLPNLAQADTVKVPVMAGFTPVRAEGLLLSEEGIVEKLSPEISVVKPGQVSVNFQVSKSELNPDTMASAVLFGEHGEVGFGTVVYPEVDTGGQACPEEIPPDDVLAEDAGVIRSLVGIRAKRRDVALSKFSIAFAEFSPERLELLEARFGLRRDLSQGNEINPYTMVDRLSRLLAAIHAFQFRKNAIPSAAASSEDQER